MCVSAWACSTSRSVTSLPSFTEWWLYNILDIDMLFSSWKLNSWTVKRKSNHIFAHIQTRILSSYRKGKSKQRFYILMGRKKMGETQKRILYCPSEMPYLTTWKETSQQMPVHHTCTTSHVQEPKLSHRISVYQNSREGREKRNPSAACRVTYRK